MEILFLIPSLKLRGAERMLVNLVNALDHDRFSIHVVSLSQDNPLADKLKPEAAILTLLPRVWRYDLSPARELHTMIRTKRIQAIIAFDIFAFFYAWMALWRIRPRPKIFISIHNMQFKTYRHWLQNFIYARLLSGNEIFIAVCDAQIDYWTKSYRIPKNNFLTIHNGVDTRAFSPTTDLSQIMLRRNQLGIAKDTFVILHTASLAPEKGHEDAFVALKQFIHETNAPVILLCVGHGPDERKRYLHQFARNLGVHEHIRFCGAQEDVKPFYEIADIFTLTSHTEAFSVAALEAMSMGVPCVLTDVGGAREMIVEGMNGYLVQAGDSRRIAEGWAAAYRNRCCFERQRIRNWVIGNFSLFECARRYENLLENISRKEF
jgi:glycosyltransferase involved in cell wall biosynthesis